MKRIYLACPYTHKNEEIEDKRFIEVSHLAATITEQLGKEVLVYSPITHGHPITRSANLPPDWEHNKEHCLSFLDHWATELWVLELEGFEKSIGVQAEIEYAKKLKLPITKISVTELNTYQRQYDLDPPYIEYEK